MTSINPQIVIFDNDLESVGRMERAFADADLHTFNVRYLPADKVRAEPGFDAIYLTLSAAERWNARPIEGVIQIKRTSEEDRGEGWPAYVLAGLVLNAADASNANVTLRLWARALLKAVSEHDIPRVKVPISMMPMQGLSAECVAQTLADVEHEAA